MVTPRLDQARRAVGLVFVVNGFAFASWVARLPELRDGLGLTPGTLGLLLLCLSAGTVVALPTSGVVISRLGPSRTVLGGATAVGAGLVLMAAGLAGGTVPVVGAALFAYGAGSSLWDVAMNVEAADVERRLGRVVMARFHAGFSLGTVGGALVGALSAHTGLPLPGQLLMTVGVVAVAVVPGARRFLPLTSTMSTTSTISPWRAWREGRTLAIGLLVMAFALCEGIANDWLALALVDGYDATPALGSLAFAAFVSSMTAGRLVGSWFIIRFGRVTTLRATAVLVLAGVTAVVVSPGVPGALAGAVLWGLGASLGFPTGMTAAGEDESRSAARLSVVSSIGYAAFLGGPPLVGTLADHVGVRDAVLVAGVAAVVGLVAARAAAPSTPDPVGVGPG